MGCTLSGFLARKLSTYFVSLQLLLFCCACSTPAMFILLGSYSLCQFGCLCQDLVCIFNSVFIRCSSCFTLSKEHLMGLSVHPWRLWSHYDNSDLEYYCFLWYYCCIWFFLGWYAWCHSPWRGTKKTFGILISNRILYANVYCAVGSLVNVLYYFLIVGSHGITLC